jgi:two-component system sensor histidine kinase FlrB
VGAIDRSESHKDAHDSCGALTEALHGAVQSGREGQVLAEHMFACSGRATVVLARRGAEWVVDGAAGVTRPAPLLATARSATAWMNAHHGAPWSERVLHHGRRVVAQLLLRGAEPPSPMLAHGCALAAPFFAAVASWRTSGALETHAAGIVHDLKQPIAVVQLALAELAGRASDSTLARCRRSLERMRALVDDLLALAPEQQRGRDELDVRTIVGEVVSDLRPTARLTGVALALEADAPAPVQGRRLGITRAVANVLQNAIQHSPDGGIVTVRVGGDGHHVIVEVSDQGPGIPPELHERVFEPFFTTREGGSGLGLAVARAAVRAQRGRIEIGDGPGCTMRLILPRSAGGLH